MDDKQGKPVQLVPPVDKPGNPVPPQIKSIEPSKPDEIKVKPVNFVNSNDRPS